MKILIIGLTGIGNTILFLPSLFALKKNFEDSEFILLTSQQKETFSFLLEHKIIDKIVSVKYSLFPIKNIFQFIKVIYFLNRKKLDISFTVYSGISTFKIKLITFLIYSKKRYIHGSKNNYIDKINNIVKYKEVHDVINNFNLIYKLFIKINHHTINFENFINKEFCANIFREIGIQKIPYKSNYNNKEIKIGIQPFASHTNSKIWPTKFYIKLIKMLYEKYNIHFTIFGSNAEKNKISKIKNELQNLNISLMVGEPFQNVILNIMEMDYFISNDSALMHVAAFSNVYVFGLFGPTDPLRTSPFSNKSKIISINYNCSPCIENKLYKSCTHFNCMRQLTPEFVYKQIEVVISRS